MKIAFCCIVFLLSFSTGHANEQDHKALRLCRNNLLEAFHKGNFELLQANLCSEFSITFADQSQFSDIEAIKVYYAKLRNESQIESIIFNPVADTLSNFLNPTTAVCHGSSVDQFIKNDGSVVGLHSRWSATLSKVDDEWKLASLHCGVNFLDNSYIHKLNSFWKILTFIVGAISMLVGYVLPRRKIKLPS